jgi:hypothetical protein
MNKIAITQLLNSKYYIANTRKWHQPPIVGQHTRIQRFVVRGIVSIGPVSLFKQTGYLAGPPREGTTGVDIRPVASPTPYIPPITPSAHHPVVADIIDALNTKAAQWDTEGIIIMPRLKESAKNFVVLGYKTGVHVNEIVEALMLNNYNTNPREIRDWYHDLVLADNRLEGDTN